MKKKLMRYVPAFVGSSAFALGSLANSVFAAGVADTNVTGAFTTVGDNITATMGAVAPFAIGVMACLLGFRYGKKIFKVISNG
jgi:hypothetical protein